MKDYRKIYLDNITNKSNLKKPLRIVFDCSNGPAGHVFKNLRIKNAEINLINKKVDGNFPAHGPNPFSPGALSQLRREMYKKKADLGVAFDGDGDRVFFLDNKGRLLPSYIIVYLLSFTYKPPFIADIFTFKSIEYTGFLKHKVYPSRVGYYFIKKAAKRYDSSFGAEWSNHYSFKETYYSDSGLLAVIRVMNVLSSLPYSLADFFDLTPKFYFDQFNIKTKNPKALLEKIKGNYEKKAISIDKIDGFAFNFKDWLFVVRASNTEPLIRLFVGARNKKVFEENLLKIKSLA